MARPKVPPTLLKAIGAALPGEKAPAAAGGKDPAAAGRKEPDPRTRAAEKQSIRPARTAIAHQRGGNKGK